MVKRDIKEKKVATEQNIILTSEDIAEIKSDLKRVLNSKRIAEADRLHREISNLSARDLLKRFTI